MKVTRSLKRAAAVAAYEIHGGKASIVKGKGIVSGARLEGIRDGVKEVMAVRTSEDRVLGFARDADGDWRTLSKVQRVLAVVPRNDGPSGVEVFFFSSDVVIDYFERAKAEMIERDRLPASEIPTLIPLDEGARKNVGHSVSGLSAKKEWHELFSTQELMAMIDNSKGESFIERVKREFAEINDVDVSKVSVDFRIKD